LPARHDRGRAFAIRFWDRCSLSRQPTDYATNDSSVNSPIVALLTFGTGWHNNHHRYAASARAGFAWYEIDVTYYSLRLLAMLGLVSDLRPVPRKILEEGGILRAAELERDYSL
jgi:hypothetical protein